jgi:transcription antitermination factor NusG
MTTLDLEPAGAVCDPFVETAGGLWFLLRTRSRQEKIIAGDLAARGVAHFLPLMTCTRMYGHRRSRVELPLFPGYVFLRGGADDAYAADRAGRVAQIIPIINQERVHQELQHISFALAREGALEPYPYLKQGVRVEVRCGPFRGLRGMIADLRQRDRLILQVETLGRAVSLEIDAAFLDVID